MMFMAYNCYLVLFMFSYLASCGLNYINQTNGAYLGLPTGYVQKESFSYFSALLHISRYFLLTLVCIFQVCIILGVALMIVSPIGGLRQIIIEAKDYEFFS